VDQAHTSIIYVSYNPPSGSELLPLFKDEETEAQVIELVSHRVGTQQFYPEDLGT
jgi:hypothetical protein